MLEIGHNLRWSSHDDCEWVITATDPSITLKCNMQHPYKQIILLKILFVYCFFFVFILDKHVSLTIMHIENEPVIQRMIAQMDNTTVAECTATITVSFLKWKKFESS